MYVDFSCTITKLTVASLLESQVKRKKMSTSKNIFDVGFENEASSAYYHIELKKQRLNTFHEN